jgi:DNA-binding LytR/AlgR family response regulator
MHKELETYNCLVVDDEPIARKIIANYIAQMPQLELAAESINALGAIDHLKKNRNTDIIFLDINMPHLSGLQLVKILQPSQPVIFTTAYAEHAVESYDLNAIDYLLKPFSFERFAKAVYKAIDAVRNARSDKGLIPPDKKPDLFIKSDGRNYPVQVEDILYGEAMKNYTRVVMKSGQRLMPLIALSRLEALLLEAGGDFIQTHRSFIVSRKYITAVSQRTVSIDKFEIPVGIQFRDRLFVAIGMKPAE